MKIWDIDKAAHLKSKLDRAVQMLAQASDARYGWRLHVHFIPLNHGGGEIPVPGVQPISIESPAGADIIKSHIEELKRALRSLGVDAS